MFNKKEIKFPNGYFFKQSQVNTSKKILSTEISEVNLNTFPPSLVYKDIEVIFVKNDCKNSLKDFAKKNNIPIIDRLDIWEHMCRPYLDTEFEEQEKVESLKLLEANGVSRKDVTQIRKKINFTMFLNFIVWEWCYLGLYDYLSWTFLNKKKYWWAMEVALRNYFKLSATA